MVVKATACRKTCLTRLTTSSASFHYFRPSRRAMNATAENQPRRNEEHEEGTGSIFVFFVSSWLILIVSHASLTT
jgi:hypothetical protein